jgi:hypothetical protein
MRIIPAAIVLSMGCGGESKLDKLPNSSANVAANVERAKARVALIKKDFKLIADKAVDRMRRAAHEDFGSKAAEEAVITADEKNVKVLGDERWQVTGQYSGKDEEGKSFVAPFTVNLQILMYSLFASDIELNERKYQN